MNGSGHKSREEEGLANAGYEANREGNNMEPPTSYRLACRPKTIHKRKTSADGISGTSATRRTPTRILLRAEANKSWCANACHY